jgi:hypothetical protein
MRMSSDKAICPTTTEPREAPRQSTQYQIATLDNDLPQRILRYLYERLKTKTPNHLQLSFNGC